jgi:hypothetical protein
MIFGYSVVMKRGDEKGLIYPLLRQERTEESLLTTGQGGEMITVFSNT